MLNQPPVGSTVSVTTEHKGVYLGQDFDYNFYEDVKVLPSQKYDKPNTFRVKATDSVHIQERVIPLKSVSILIVDGQQYIDDGTSNELITVKVDGSKGRKYTVTIMGGNPIECDCTGFKFRRTCRHLAEALTIVDL